MYITIYKNAMQLGKVTATGNNIGGLVGYSFVNNTQTNGAYLQNCYAIIENSFATRRNKRRNKCRRTIRTWK